MAKEKLFHFSPFVIGFILLTFSVVGIFCYRELFILPQNPPSASLTNSAQYVLLADVATWYPSAQWSTPEKTTQTTYYGTLQGLSIHTQTVSDQPTLGHFEDIQSLATNKFLPDTNLEADGTGSSSWGYIKITSATKRILTFSYKTIPSKSPSDQPLQFSCPCKIDITVFASNPW